MAPTAQTQGVVAYHCGAGPVIRPTEVYLGGHEKSKKGKRKKTAVVGIKDMATDTIRTILVPETTAAHLVVFIETNVDTESKKFTDENRTYNDLKNHHTVCHGDEECTRGIGAHQ